MPRSAASFDRLYRDGWCLMPEAELNRLLEAARAELADATRWGMTFTLVQAWGQTPDRTDWYVRDC